MDVYLLSLDLTRHRAIAVRPRSDVTFRALPSTPAPHRDAPGPEEKVDDPESITSSLCPRPR
jgi:hypothetical protein